MATQLNHGNTSIKLMSKQIRKNHLVMGIAAALLSTSLFAGIGVNANADVVGSPITAQLSTDSYTLPAPNDEGNVVEQQISQNVSRPVNVNGTGENSQTQVQVGTITGSQLYDQTHGVVLEGHVNPVVWHSINLPTTKTSSSLSAPKNASILTSTKGVTSLQKGSSSFDSAQPTHAAFPVLTETADAMELSSKPNQESNQTAAAENDHIAGASFGLTGLLAMMTGLAIWKKQTN